MVSAACQQHAGTVPSLTGHRFLLERSDGLCGEGSEMYLYEAFFSYKRHTLTDEWHRELMTRIQFWLSQDLGVQDAPVFFDTRSIPNGMLFAQEIDDALRASKVIVSVMSPLYFTSDHCMAEIG